MADNTLLNTGTGGDVIASDDIAGVKHQMVKIEFGALDTATLVSSTNPLPVGLRDTLGQSTNSAATGFLKVSDEPHQMFYDSFDAALDTTNMWTSTQGSSGVAAAVALGVMSMGTGTVASGYSKLISIPTFKPTIPGWVVFSDAIQIPDAATPTQGTGSIAHSISLSDTVSLSDTTSTSILQPPYVDKNGNYFSGGGGPGGSSSGGEGTDSYLMDLVKLKRREKYLLEQDDDEVLTIIKAFVISQN